MARLRIQRMQPDPQDRSNTWGLLHVDDFFHSYVVEDELRAPGVKVHGLTAIPAGEYKVILSVSKRFGKLLPEVLGVPMFEGIRLHGGRDAKDSEGCPCLGYGKSNGKLTQTIQASEALVLKLKTSKDKEHILTIRDPVGWTPPWATPSVPAT